MAQGRAVEYAALADLSAAGAVSHWVAGADGVGLHVLEYGKSAPGSAAPVVVVPGITMPAFGMDFVAAQLARDRQVFVLDVRGRGLSQSAPTYSIGDYARDLAAVCDALGLQGAVFVGHSMGARIVAAAAASGMPGRAWVIVDPPLSGPGRAPYPTSLEAFVGQVEEAYRGATVEEVAASWPRWPARELEIRTRWLPSCDLDAVAATHRGFETEDFLPFWQQVPSPVVFIRGSDSPVVTDSSMEEVRAVRPDAVYREIPDAGHMVFWDNVDGALSCLVDAVRETG